MNDRGHLSAETIDLLMLGSLAEPEGAKAKAHLSSCQTCKARWDELEEDKAHFEKFVFPRTLPKIEERARGRFLADRIREKWQILVPAFGLVAAALVAVVALPQHQAADEPYIGIKGPPSMKVYAQRAEGGQLEVKDGTALKPGDRIRFVVNPAGAKHVVIASKDGAGQVTVFYAQALEDGLQELPGSIELDEALGREEVVAAFSDRPLSADEVKGALERGSSSIPGAKAALTLTFEKVAK